MKHSVVLARSACTAFAGLIIACALPFGLSAHAVPIALILFGIICPWHWFAAEVVGRLHSPASQRVFILVGSYVWAVALVAVGGLVWGVAAHDAARTNVAGYFVWSWVYGVAFLPFAAPASVWVLKPLLLPWQRRAQGFDVLPPVTITKPKPAN